MTSADSGPGELWAQFSSAVGGAGEPAPEPAPPPADRGPAARVEDDVASLFSGLDDGGEGRIGEETRRLVFHTRPAARDLNKIVSVLVRTLVQKREVTERDLDLLLEITKSKITEVIRAQALTI